MTSYASGAIGSHAVTLTANKTVGLDINNAGNTFTVSTAMTQGTGGLTKSGAGTLVLTDNNTYTGTTTVSAGTLSLDRFGGAIADSGNVTVSGGTLNVAQSDTVNVVTLSSGTISGTGTLTSSSYKLTDSGSISAILAGAGTLTKTGAGTAILSGNNTYTGLTTITTGVLSVSNIGNNGSPGNLGNVTSGTYVYLDGTLQYTGDAATTNRDLRMGTAAPTIDASGQGAINFTGTISGGGSTARTFTLSGNNTGSNTIAGVIINQTAATSVAKTGIGTWVLTGNNTYTGTTTISEGTLQFAKAGALYTGNNTRWTAANIIVANGGTLALNVGGGSEFTTGNVTTLLTNLGGLGGVVSNNGLQAGSKIAFDTTGGNFTVGNNIADSTGTGGGAIGLTKRGSNTLTLTGANTYTGSTLVTSGTLLVNGSVGGGGISVQTGATLGGNITAGGTTSIQSGGILSVGNSPGTGIFSTLNLAGTTVMEFNANPNRGSAGIEYDTVGVSSVLSYGGDLKLTFAGTVSNDNVNPFTLFTGLATKSNDFANVYIYAGATPVGSLGNTGGVWTGQANLGYGDGQQSFTFTQANGDLIVAAVPEPQTWALLAFSLTTVMVLRRRRRKTEIGS
jgi:autotransporter-associated beta strand protein